MSFRDVDLSLLEAFWAEVAPDTYPLSEARMRTHWTGSPLLDWGASAVEMEEGRPSAVLVIKRSASTLYRGPDPDTAHIAAFACRECQQGVDLLARAKGLLSERGVYKLAFGQDSLHLFPGCPDNWPKLHDFLMVEGFEEKSPCVDLVQDLAAFEPICDSTPEARCVGESDVVELRHFLEREFPGRWLYDTMQKVELEGRSDFVVGLFLNGKCEGFAVTQDDTHTLPIGGATFLVALGNNACAVGPIGVSAHIRGQGWGDRLLSSTLSRLKSVGKRRCRVDWTSLVGWYGRHGFAVEREYKPMTLSLEQAEGEAF